MRTSSGPPEGPNMPRMIHSPVLAPDPSAARPMTSFDPEPLPADEELTIRGDIETSSVPELLRSLLSSGETGVLTVRNGDDVKTISIDRGRIVYASSNNVDERLGEILLVRGQASPSRQFLEASKLIRPGRAWAPSSSSWTRSSPDELVPAVEFQVREILMELFDLDRAATTSFVIRTSTPRRWPC